MHRSLLPLLLLVVADRTFAGTIISEDFDALAPGTTLPTVTYAGGTGIAEVVGGGTADASITADGSGQDLDVNIPLIAGAANTSVSWNTTALSFSSLGGGPLNSFTISTEFTIDSIDLGNATQSTLNLMLVGFGTNPNFTLGSNYRLIYTANATGSAVTTGKLGLSELNAAGQFTQVNSAQTNSVNAILGKVITLTLTGSYNAAGTALTLNGSMQDGATELASVTATDTANLVAGTNFGYRTAVNAGGTTAVAQNVDYDKLRVTTVPEPASVFFLGIGALPFLLRRSRR